MDLSTTWIYRSKVRHVRRFYHEAWHLFFGHVSNTILETYDIPNSSQCLYKFVSKCPFQDWTLWICNYLLILILCFSNIPTMFVQKTSQGFRNPIKKKTCRFALFCIWKRWWPSCCISQYKIVQSLCAEIYGASTGGWLVLGPGNLRFFSCCFLIQKSGRKVENTWQQMQRYITWGVWVGLKMICFSR